MPQMSPLNWSLLFMMITWILMLFSIMNYYNINYKPSNLHLSKKNKKINWKW